MLVRAWRVSASIPPGTSLAGAVGADLPREVEHVSHPNGGRKGKRRRRPGRRDVFHFRRLVLGSKDSGKGESQ